MLPTKFGGDMASKAPHQCLSLETTEKNQSWYRWSLIKATESDYFSLLNFIAGGGKVLCTSSGQVWLSCRVRNVTSNPATIKL